ncbi:ABC transporter substrate-binding protein [Piscinibacter sakaiensis]|uniref:Hydroxymethylpyrimidine ABC transporter, substrate-binding component n=1 Tax=Piscinibacter sakaiensis TaxID=1547922 RepID=A0A0K8P0W4_PISS1|nr:ABC transporter substrate-binding protein [Piscinibacter sakaiensis]GAP35810.1 hydroxymethylpyrimidine ABC transporter, substrate-binding component [Piscinibacter sakaiensis]
MTDVRRGPPTPIRPDDASRRRTLGRLGGLAVAGLASGLAAAQPREAVRFATNWKAQAAHGGFYQALADGTYARAGLDVSIVQGGPQVNNRPLLPAGRIDFLMTGNLLHSFDNVKNGVPTVVVAAMFQKDPQALIAHPGQGYEAFEALKSAPVALIAKDGQFTWWQWLKAVHGFRDEALKPYNYNLGPFLANKRAIQQGYSVAEPIYVENQGRFKPVVHLLADHGFSTYSTLIEATRETVARRPGVVQRFVDASILGWSAYLNGDRRQANALMLKDNPEMTEAEIEASVALMRSQGIVDSGEARERGIGSLSPARIEDFYRQMVRAGLYKSGEVDLAKVASFDFVGKRVGLPAAAGAQPPR